MAEVWSVRAEARKILRNQTMKKNVSHAKECGFDQKRTRNPLKDFQHRNSMILNLETQYQVSDLQIKWMVTHFFEQDNIEEEAGLEELRGRLRKRTINSV